MKPLLFIRKVYLTFRCVSQYLPDVLDELKDLKGATFLMINQLRIIWGK